MGYGHDDPTVSKAFTGDTLHSVPRGAIVPGGAGTIYRIGNRYNPALHRKKDFSKIFSGWGNVDDVTR
jgi:hypothetical protein